MTVCVDTNALLPMLSLTHPARAIRLAWMKGRFIWALSTEIMLEYEEIALPRISQRRWQEFVDMLTLAEALHSNVRKISPAYRFHLITACPEDDKFADFVITSDNHFNVLIGSGYKPQPITPEEFIARHLTAAP